MFIYIQLLILFFLFYFIIYFIIYYLFNYYYICLFIFKYNLIGLKLKIEITFENIYIVYIIFI